MSDHVIPFEKLPSGFGDLVDAPPEEPAVPRPAATILLMRDGPPGLEVLLLRRSRSSGFVPGAYVFPGGRVDASDADAALFGRVDGVDEAAAAERLGSSATGVDPLAYYVAVVREAFEETGLLLARGEGAAPARGEAGPLGWTQGGAGDAVALRARDDLLEERASFAEVLERLACRVAGDAVEYIAHWITPVAEPRRYDTRFFAATVAPDRDVSLDPREMIEALWLPPARALDLNREGALPMVFPTLRTLEAFRDFRSPDEALASFRGRPVQPTLPRLVRTSTGIGIELPGE
ncbi:MAG: hypothetical protein WDZ89_01590 [Gemmatimonadota bacterium]